MNWSERKPIGGEWLTGYDHHDVEVLFHYYCMYADNGDMVFLYANKDGTFDYDAASRLGRLPESIKTAEEAKQYIEVLYRMGELKC